ncbi:MAG: PIN domain-containing protein [Actinobacteria bacterium]|nr:PIN domain-containing protein [Actinomycetota bacterium]
MAKALDTCILVHAVSAPPPESDGELARKRRDCKALIMQQQELCIPGIVVVEFLPFLRPAEEPAARELLEKIDVLPFGADAALLAADLVADARKSGSVCDRCLNPLNSRACKGCNRNNSRGNCLQDYFVAASAAVAPHVDTLFTYDIREHLVVALKGRLNIVRPEDTRGPLFAYVDEVEEEGRSR